jgi:hypothetical protein
MPSKFLVFIAYHDGTGFDIAEHLRTQLGTGGISGFVAKKDIPSEIKLGEKWREIIDNVIETCNTFILILTTDKLSTEVTRETKKAFERNKKDSKFSILICHLQSAPRTSEQLLNAGIDSREYQQIDFTTQYDLARKVTLDNQGFPKAGGELLPEREPPNVLFDCQLPTQGAAYDGIPISWNLPFTFSNRGTEIARISESVIKLVVEGPVDNIVGGRHGFGPQNRDDFFVKPNDPKTDFSTVRISPKNPGLDWGKKYVEAYKAGKMKLTIKIHFVVSDDIFHNKEPHDKIIEL